MTVAQNSLEIFARRRVLLQYIAADPVVVQFIRYTRPADGAGGWKKGPAISPGPSPQTMRLVPYKRRLTNLTDHTADGDIPNVQYSLVSRWDADVERWDEFFMNDAWFKVMGIEPKTELAAMSDRLTILIQIRDKDR